jgi:hypothetical protein
MLLNSRTLRGVKSRSNDVNLVTVSDEAAGKSLSEASGAVNVGSKCVTGQNDFEWFGH